MTARDSLKKRRRKYLPGWISPLVLLIAALVAAIGILALNKQEKQGTATTADGQRQTNSSERLTAISLTAVDDAWTLSLNEDGLYVLANAPDAAVNQTAASELFSRLTVLTAAPVEAGDNLSAYSLSPAVADLTLYSEEGKKTIQLGALAPSGSGRYLRMDGKVYKASLFLDGIPGQGDLRAVPTLYIGKEMPENFTVVKRNGAHVSGGVNHGRSVGVTTLMVSEPFQWEMDIEQASKLIGMLEAMQIGSWQGEATDAQLAACGLDDPLRLSVNYLQETGESVGWTMLIGAQAENGYYMRLEGDGNIFLIDKETVDYLETLEATTLMNRFAGLISLTAMTEATVAWPEGSLDLVCDEAQAVYKLNRQSVDEASFKTLYQQLIAPRVDGLLPQNAPLDGTIRLCLTYQIVDGTTETIAYRAWTDDYDVVDRNGQCLFYIGREKVDQAIEAARQCQP